MEGKEKKRKGKEGNRGEMDKAISVPPTFENVPLPLVKWTWVDPSVPHGLT